MFRFGTLKGRIVGGALLLLGLGCCWPAFAQRPLADPTRPPIAAPGSAAESASKPVKWQLTSTLIGPQRRVAVINGRAVRVGQTIDGAVLAAVEPGSVMLRHQGREIHLKLIKDAVKQAVTAAP